MTQHQQPSGAMTAIRLHEEYVFLRSQDQDVHVHVQTQNNGSPHLLCGISAEDMTLFGHTAVTTTVCDVCMDELHRVPNAIERTYSSQDHCPRCRRTLINEALRPAFQTQTGLPRTCRSCAITFDSWCMSGEECVFCASARRASAYEIGRVYPAFCFAPGTNVLLSVRWTSQEEPCGERTRARYQLLGVSGTPSIDLEGELGVAPYQPDRPCDDQLPGHFNLTWIVDQAAWDALYAANEQFKAQQEEEFRYSLHPVTLSADVQVALKQYGSSTAAWDREDERAWAILHAAGY